MGGYLCMHVVRNRVNNALSLSFPRGVWRVRIRFRVSVRARARFRVSVQLAGRVGA